MIAAGNGHTPFMRFLLDEDIDPALSSDSGTFTKAWSECSTTDQ